MDIEAIQHLPPGPPTNTLLSRLPKAMKHRLLIVYWLAYDIRDFVAEIVGWLPSNQIRCFLWRGVGVKIGRYTSIHRNCRFYCPSRVQIGCNTIVNRDVLLDGRMGLTIGSNVSISEGAMVLSFEHDPSSSTFEGRGSPTQIQDHTFIGVRAIVLPGRLVGEGAVVAAGAVVTHDVSPYTIVGGAPARPIRKRRQDLAYTLNYRKFLG